jgi:hypothetical protein
MDDAVTRMHLRAGEAYGRGPTCGNKIKYGHEETAVKAASKLTITYTKPLEAYPCFFCQSWHIGRAMTEEERVKFS